MRWLGSNFFMNELQFPQVYFEHGTAIGGYGSRLLLALIRGEATLPQIVNGQRFHLMELVDPTCGNSPRWWLKASGKTVDEATETAHSADVLVVLNEPNAPGEPRDL